MSRYQVTVNPGSRLAVVRTIQAHGTVQLSQSLFHGAERKVITLS